MTDKHIDNFERLDAPEGFKIVKIEEVDLGTTRYVFAFDQTFSYRVSELDLSINDTELIDKEVTLAVMERLVEEMERCIAKYKETVWSD